MKFQNVKVPADINKYLSSLTFTDEDEDNADDLQLAFDDRERKWLGSWLEVKPTFIKTTTTVQKQVETASVVNYVVKKGDTLWAIAKKYLGSGTKYPQIASENNIKNPNLIYPGQVFKITTGGTATQTVTETKETTKKVSDPKLITATIGAKTKSIMLQFLSESAIITLIGGVVGILLGIGGAFGVAKVIAMIQPAFAFTPSVSPAAVLVTTLFSIGIGIFFGIYPAKKAAGLSPIEALRRN